MVVSRIAQTITPKSKMANVAEEVETAEQMLHDITRNPGDLLAVIGWCGIYK
jgi:hypothetical protein